MPPSTPLWRVLGLSVGIGYNFLGGCAILLPGIWNDFFGLSADRSTISQDDKSPTATLQRVKDHNSAVSTALALLGWRDIAIGCAICTFWYLEDVRGMAVTILTGMVVCAADVYHFWVHKSTADTLTLGAGAAYWGIVGGKLLVDCIE